MASTAIHDVEEVVRMLDDSEELQRASGAEAVGNAETVSIRVSGFMAAEGIT